MYFTRPTTQKLKQWEHEEKCYTLVSGRLPVLKTIEEYQQAYTSSKFVSFKKECQHKHKIISFIKEFF